MPNVRVDRGATTSLDRVEGELRVARGGRVVAKAGSIVVTGGAYFDGDADLACDFSCDSLTVDRGALKVTGDLTVQKVVDVAHQVKVTGTVTAGEIRVGGKLVAASVSCAGTIRVGGLVEVSGTLAAKFVDVGGKVVVRGMVRLEDLGVGGFAEVGGGTIAGKAKVGGIFQSTAQLQFGDIQVYGKCSLPAGCKGHRIAATGKLSVAGDLECEEVEVGGVASVKGSCSSKKVTINGKLNVSGALSAADVLDNFGSGEVGGDFTGGDLHMGGRFKARKAVLQNEAQIAGYMQTTNGTKAKSVSVGSGSRCRGPLVGDRVELSKSKMVISDWGAHWAGQDISMRLIGRTTSADDVYGSEVVLGPNSRCRNVFGKVVDMHSGSVVEQVTYTDKLNMSHGAVHVTKPSEKVEKLPPFPL